MKQFGGEKNVRQLIIKCSFAVEIESRRLLKPPKNIEEEAMENFMEDTPLWVAYKKCRGTLSKLRNMEKFIGMMNINICVGEY